MLIFEESEPALWLGTSGAGLFMSSVFPTSIALAEYYIDLTGNYHYHAKYHIRQQAISVVANSSTLMNKGGNLTPHSVFLLLSS